eukprot:GHVR01001395.1.p1 GENE.GHVR01001395.1~~GHVR01001395.1.p1  ORF type:complete len:141 (+),score=11.45 GHVR01001395.1:496-918(+)
MSTSIPIMPFNSKDFERWEKHFNDAMLAKKMILTLTTQSKEPDAVENATNSLMWLELQIAVAGNKEATELLEGLESGKRTPQDGLTCLRLRYSRNDAQKKDAAVRKQEGFHFEGGESLFGGLTRLKGFVDAANKASADSH